MSEFILPDKCKGCPVQHKFQDKLAWGEVGGTILNLVGKTLIGEEGEQFEMELHEDLAEAEAEEVITNIRQGVSEMMDITDSDIEKVQKESEGYSRSCDGVLRMRAEKEGKEYLVSVCTSARAYYLNNFTPDLVPALVSVSPVSD